MQVVTAPSLGSLDLVNSSSVPSLGVTTTAFPEWPGHDLLDVDVLPEVSHALRIVAALVYSLVCAVGLCGNLLVLCLIRGVNGRDTSALDLFVFHLALADFHFVLVLPFWAAEIALDHSWPFGNTMCKLVLFVTVLNMYASVFFLTAMSLSRYCSVAQTLRLGRNPFRPCVAKWVSLVIWLVATTASLPPTIYSKTINIQGEELCIQQFPDDGYWLEVYQIQKFIVAFIVPLIVISVSYISLLHLLRTHKLNGHNPVAPSNVTRLVIIIVLSFFLCWLPNQIIVFWGVLVKLGLVYWGRAYYVAHTYIHPLTICLANTNSCLNPIIYCLMRKEFRKSVTSLLRRICSVASPWMCLPAPCSRGRREGGQEAINLNQMDNQPVDSTGGDTPSSHTSNAVQKI